MRLPGKLGIENKKIISKGGMKHNLLIKFAHFTHNKTRKLFLKLE
jgi:hypothetical protein